MLITTGDMFDFFYDRLSTVNRPLQGSASLNENVVIYLADLLMKSARQESHPFTEIVTLTELYGKASGERPTEACLTYQAMGDRTLLTLGWFPASLDNQPVGRSYYEDMGKSAYSRAHSMREDELRETFGVIAIHYEECVRVIDSARPKSPLEQALRMRSCGES